MVFWGEQDGKSPAPSPTPPPLATQTVSLWSVVLHPELRGAFVNPAYFAGGGMQRPAAEEVGADPAKLVPVIPATRLDALQIWPYWSSRWMT
jgi:hypothetical protein